MVPHSTRPRPYTEQTFNHLKGLDGISDDQIAEHVALYAGYVTQVNALNEELEALRLRGRASGRDLEFAELTRRLGFEYNGMILHEYYFSNLRGGAEPRPAPMPLGDAASERRVSELQTAARHGRLGARLHA